MLDRRRFGLLSLAAAIPAAPAWSQTVEALSAERQFWLEGRYLPRYLELKAAAAGGDIGAARELAQFAALIGDDATAIGADESIRQAPLPAISTAVAVNALDAIAEAAANARVVILNEAHNISGHRAFATQVMRRLRPLGFDLFAAETFIPKMPTPAPSMRSFDESQPLLPTLGYYTRDPVYAETVREAASLGYRFVDYEERNSQQASPDATAEEQIAAREEAQADNLIEALSERPDERVFVYCGYAHAMEKPSPHGTWFAARFKAKSGIDPVTIEQSFNWPGTSPDHDVPHVAAALERFNPIEPICVSVDGRPLMAPTYGDRMDLSVFHPRLPDVQGRSGWRAADRRRQAVTVRLPDFSGPALLQAMRMAEGPGAVPADQLLLAEGQQEATLFLPPSGYFLRIEDLDGVRAAFGAIDLTRPSAT